MDELNQPSGNPYGQINNEEDDGQPPIACSGSVPRETSPLGTDAPFPIENKVVSNLALFDLERYAKALRAIPSGNPCARAQCDDEEVGSKLADDLDEMDAPLSAFGKEEVSVSPEATFANPYRYIDNDSSDPQPYYAAGERMPWEASSEQRPSGRSSRAWALPFISQTDPRGRARKRYRDQQIEEMARSIQRTLWQQRSELFGGTDDPIRVLNSVKVLELYGYTVRHHKGGLGHDKQDGVMVDVAGLIDPSSKVVEISMLPSPMERLFTLAHELGHVVLGSTGAVVHRDRPLNGTRKARDIDERSADKFAAYFLMPAKLLRQVFGECYLTGCFELTEETAFALRASSLDAVQAEFPTLRALSCYLTSAERYNGRVFRSLASIFNVSEVAMAIRLEELGLVR